MEQKKNSCQSHSTSDKKNDYDSRPLSTSNKQEIGENPKKYQFYRKPSIKKKGPEVKQTKTSLRRLQQANPLLHSDIKGLENRNLCRRNSIEYENKNKQIPKEKTVTKPKDIKTSAPSKNPTSQYALPKPRISNILSGNGISEHVPRNARKHVEFSASTPRLVINDSAPSKPDCFKIPCENNLKCKITAKPVEAVSGPSDSGKTSRDRPLNHSKPIRRSLSAQHFDRRRGSTKILGNCSSELIKKTQSFENISIPVQGHSGHGVSPIAEVSNENVLVFKTPSAHERRSICQFTPRSANITRRSIYHPSTPLPTLEALQKRLNEWLTKRGKSISHFYHLKNLDDENKENIEVDQDLDKSSYEDLGILELPNENVGEIKNVDWENVAKAALVELNNLIQEGYSISQCEEWLELIRAKYGKLQEEPEYWECRAAIEQSRGNIGNAVECYRTAIVQGAEIQVVDQSLDVLLQKFSLLNISMGDMDETAVKDRARIVQDARNVFKSSIIKFAVQEKKIKKNSSEIKLVATPVRRSTRLSRSAYLTTPGFQICSSLKELESPDKINFVKNKALN